MEDKSYYQIEGQSMIRLSSLPREMNFNSLIPLKNSKVKERINKNIKIISYNDKSKQYYSSKYQRELLKRLSNINNNKYATTNNDNSLNSPQYRKRKNQINLQDWIRLKNKYKINIQYLQQCKRSNELKQHNKDKVNLNDKIKSNYCKTSINTMNSSVILQNSLLMLNNKYSNKQQKKKIIKKKNQSNIKNNNIHHNIQINQFQKQQNYQNNAQIIIYANSQYLESKNKTQKQKNILKKEKLFIQNNSQANYKINSSIHKKFKFKHPAQINLIQLQFSNNNFTRNTINSQDKENHFPQINQNKIQQSNQNYFNSSVLNVNLKQKFKQRQLQRITHSFYQNSVINRNKNKNFSLERSFQNKRAESHIPFYETQKGQNSTRKKIIKNIFINNIMQKGLRKLEEHRISEDSFLKKYPSQISYKQIFRKPIVFDMGKMKARNIDQIAKRKSDQLDQGAYWQCPKEIHLLAPLNRVQMDQKFQAFVNKYNLNQDKLQSLLQQSDNT